MDYLDKLIQQRLEEHQREIEQLEKKLQEYKGLISEKQIKIEESYLKIVKNLKLIGIELFGKRSIQKKGYIFPNLLDDWDLLISGTTWDIDASTYVSQPSSIYFSPTIDYGLWKGGILCKHPDTVNLVQGRLVVHAKVNSPEGYPADMHLNFRNQSTVGNPDDETTYLVKIFLLGNDYPTFIRRINDHPIVLGKYVGGYACSGSHNFSTWQGLRVTWWNDPNWDCLVVRLECYSDSENKWIPVSNDLLDSENAFKDSQVNRVGVIFSDDCAQCYTDPEIKCWLDDVEIWAPS